MIEYRGSIYAITRFCSAPAAPTRMAARVLILCALLVRVECGRQPQGRAAVRRHLHEQLQGLTTRASSSADIVLEQGSQLLNRASRILDDRDIKFASVQTSCYIAYQRVHVTLRMPRDAAGAAFSSCVCLAKAIPNAQSAGDAEDALKAWMGLAGGVLCGGASIVAAAACAGLALTELAAQLGKSLACKLATGLATGASFGCSAPHLRAQIAEAAAARQHMKRSHLQQTHEDGLATDKHPAADEWLHDDTEHAKAHDESRDDDLHDEATLGTEDNPGPSTSSGGVAEEQPDHEENSH